MEERRKSLQVETQELQNIRNQRSKEIGAAKGRGEDIAPLKAQMDDLAIDLKEKEQSLQNAAIRITRMVDGYSKYSRCISA